MQRMIGIALLGLATTVTVQISGCSVSSFIPPVELNLSEAGLAEFDVEAGVPLRKTGSYRFSTSGYTVGSGSLQLNPEDVSVTPAGTEGSKMAVTMQDGTVGLSDLLEVESCLDACDLAGVDAEVCSEVCEEGVILVFFIISAADDTDCENGNAYEARITLDEQVQVTGVSVSPNAFIGNTEDLLNSGEFRLCVEVLAGFDASIQLATLELRVGL